MIPHSFQYHAPKTLAEAAKLLAANRDEAKILAGGHSLLPMMKLRFARPEHLIDLGKIAELKGIAQVGDAVHIGAMTTENELIWSALLAEKIPILVETARLISDPQVRYKGTIGGDISHGDPGNDHPAVMLALGASFVLIGPKGERVLPANGFFLDTFSTQMAADEIMTQIRIPIPPAGTGWCYSKLKRKTGDFASAAAAVLLRMKGGNVADVQIALTNLGATPLRASAAEDALRGKPPNDAAFAEAARLAMRICSPGEDQRGSAEYKTAMAGEMTIRALRTAQSRAK